ncbi:MAG: VWA domain-containing protein [Candidatus Aminicenantes bacterium]|nr:VWA domain-containing protein [Candidatus Aminicenantes bacterium]
MFHHKPAVFVILFLCVFHFVWFSTFADDQQASGFSVLSENIKCRIWGKHEFDGGIQFRISASSKTVRLGEPFSLRFDINAQEIPDLEGVPKEFFGITSQIFLIYPEEAFSIEKVTIKVDGRTIVEALREDISTIMTYLSGSLTNVLNAMIEKIKDASVEAFRKWAGLQPEYEIKIEKYPDELVHIQNKGLLLNFPNVADFTKAEIDLDIKFNRAGEHPFLVVPDLRGIYLSPTPGPGLVQITTSAAKDLKLMEHRYPVIFSVPVVEAFKAGEGTALALIIDSTGSMRDNDPQNTRIFGGQLVLDQAGIDWELGLVDFDSLAVLIGAGSPREEELKRRLEQIDSSGQTNIEAGLKTGFDYLLQPNKSQKGAILLTDGVHNNPSSQFNFSEYVGAYTQKGWPVFTIGLTGDANAVLLSEIASMTGGIYLKANTYQDMIGIIDIILSHFKQEALLVHEKRSIQQDETINIPFFIDGSVQTLNFMGTYPGSRLEFRLVDPDGDVFSSTDDSKGIEVFEGDIYKIIKVDDPSPGEWQARIIGEEVDGASEPFEVKVSAESPIKVSTIEAKPVYSVYEPIEFKADISGEIDAKTAKGSVKITDPEGNVETVSVQDDMKIRYEKTGKPGVYYFDIDLEGEKKDGEKFIRRGLKHIVVSEAGTPFGVGEIIKAEGSYIEINMGSEIGLKPGKKIFVYDVSSGAKNKIAEGLVISTFVGRSVVELQSAWGSVVPRIGHLIEVDRSEF